MQWEAIVEAIKTFFNQPVPVIGCTIGFLLIFVLKVISSTSIGKKALNRLTFQHEEMKKHVTNSIKDFEKATEAAKQELADQKKYYEAHLAAYEKKYAELETLLLEIAKNVHNRRVKEIVDQYTGKGESTDGE